MSPTDHIARVPLSSLGPGFEVRVEEIDGTIDLTQREQLDAYGLAPDRALRVLQQYPMTLVMIDEVELALEASIACHVWVYLAASHCSSMQVAFGLSARPHLRCAESRRSIANSHVIGSICRHSQA